MSYMNGFRVEDPHFYPDDGGRGFLRNVDNDLADYVASHHRRQ
jgi:hypothetical protein